MCRKAVRNSTEKESWSQIRIQSETFILKFIYSEVPSVLSEPSHEESWTFGNNQASVDQMMEWTGDRLFSWLFIVMQDEIIMTWPGKQKGWYLYHLVLISVNRIEEEVGEGETQGQLWGLNLSAWPLSVEVGGPGGVAVFREKGKMIWVMDVLSLRFWSAPRCLENSWKFRFQRFLG